MYTIALDVESIQRVKRSLDKVSGLLQTSLRTSGEKEN